MKQVAPSNTLKLINLNARSIINKVLELEHILLAYNPDIVVITETWLNENILNNEIVPPGYELIRKDRRTRGGGVAIVLKSGLSVVEMEEQEKAEALWCKVKVDNSYFVVGALYRPPNAPLEILEETKEYLLNHCRRDCNIILAGDFNLPSINWTSLSAGPTEIESAECLLDIAFAFDLTQVVNSYTRIQGSSMSMLDCIFLSGVYKEYIIEVLEGISDHSLVLLELPLNVQRAQCKKTKVLDFSRADDVSIIDRLDWSLEEFVKLSENRDTTIDKLWHSFKRIVKSCITNFVPYKIKTINRQRPWINRDIIHLKRRISRARKKTKVVGTETNKQGLSNMVHDLKRMLYDAKFHYHNSTLEGFLQSSPSKFWRYLSFKQEPPAVFTINGNLTEEPEEIASSLNEHFRSVFTLDNGQLPNYTADQTLPEISDITLTEEGIFNLLLNIDPKKSVGPDLIPNAFLVRYSEWVAKYLLILFQNSLEKGVVPKEWKVAKIIPVFKSGDKKNVSNYRPISLTCQCCKLLEHIISRHIYDYVEREKILAASQHGFRKGLSTITQLLEITHDFGQVINNRGQVDVLFLDLSKAFDRVPHNKLLLKLNHILQSHKLVKWLTSYLEGREQYVSFKGYESNSVPVDSGVPQGSVLGPLLFLLYINDITKNIEVKIRLFADDCVLYNEIKSTQDQVTLNNCLEKIVAWCREWQMEINSSKTVHMTITRKKFPIEFSYNIGTQTVQKVDEYKYLGLHFNDKLLWDKHIDCIVAKATQRLWSLKRLLRYSSSKTKLTVYKTLLRPILEYANVVWDPFTKTNINKLENIQRKAIRFVYNRYDSFCSPTALLRQANLQALSERARTDRLKLLFLMVQGKLNVDTTKYISFPGRLNTRSCHARSMREYQVRLDTFKYCFFPRTIVEWNRLPAQLTNSDSLNFFIDGVTACFSN